MKHDLLISIIIPTLNQGKFIEKAIRSIIEQDHANFEMIVIDGGSTDNTLEVINKYSSYIKYWESKKDRGQSHAINEGLKVATGEIIFWLNSDDVLEKNALEIIADEFSNNKIDVLCAYAKIVDENNNIIAKKRTSEMNGSIARTIACGHIMQPTTYFLKKIFDELTPVDENLHYMMDHYIWLKYICKRGYKKVKYIDHVLAKVLFHSKAKSVNQINSFKFDRALIYRSLFNSLQFKAVSYPGRKENLLEFDSVDYLKTNVDLKEFDFWLLRELLFVRDFMGRKKSINFVYLYKLMINYPVFFFKNLFFKWK